MSGRWRYGDVVWGTTLCQGGRCVRPAVLLCDGRPLCLDCADAEVERECAIAAEPRLRELLPALGDR